MKSSDSSVKLVTNAARMQFAVLALARLSDKNYSTAQFLTSPNASYNPAGNRLLGWAELHAMVAPINTVLKFAREV